MAQRVLVLSLPQLRHCDLTPGALSSLEGLARTGSMVEYLPAFPCLASPTWATLITGMGPEEHGIVGDAFFDRAQNRVVRRPFSDALIQAPRVWDRARAVRGPDFKCMAWFLPNLADARVELAAWSEPATGIETTPGQLADTLAATLRPWPRANGNMLNPRRLLEQTAWILESASQVLLREEPELALVRVPFLGQVARRYGPDSPEANRAVTDLERHLRRFIKGLPPDTLVLAFSESIATPVSGPSFPNLVLRGHDLIELRPMSTGGNDVDTAASSAFALVDHQLCHVYLNDPNAASTIAAAFSGVEGEGVDRVVCHQARKQLGLNHPRSGEIVLAARPESWFAPDWWVIRTEKPARPDLGSGLARMGPGLSFEQVRGALGSPAPNRDYYGIILASQPGILPEVAPLTTFDMAELLVELLTTP